MSHKPNKLAKFTVLVAVLATGVLGAPTVASADQGGAAHGAKPCPSHSHSGKHNGVGHGKKNGAKKGKKCGHPTTSTQTTTTEGPNQDQANGRKPEDKAAGTPDRTKDDDEQEETGHKAHSDTDRKANHGHH